VESAHWQFWVDRGGTFTDCIGIDPAGGLHVRKVLSSDAAPVEAIRSVLSAAGVPADADPPPCRVRMGTTVATNALLQRAGVATVFVTNAGFGDLLAIGTQQRPDLFSLEIEKPAPLPALTLEFGGRIDLHGTRHGTLDEAAARRALRAARAAGARAVAIAGVHATVDDGWEARVAAVAIEAGFATVVRSAECVNEVGLLARAETAVADAYLTPLLQEHADALSRALPGSDIRYMQSSGGLTDAARFRGPRALLSGPAGGVVGAARVAAEAGEPRAIGFDMGGTSTDVSLIVDGETDRSFESVVAGVRVRAPMLEIHTVAAGGGSLCRFDGFRLTVGPESAGAQPGPLCYGHPGARELALTDVNAFLGRIRADHFPFDLDFARVDAAFAAQRQELGAAGLERGVDEIAAGFLEIANDSMAQAIQQVSVRRGVDPRDFALVGFGGAAGQHVCAVARRLGIRTVLLHPLAGLLSAAGIGVAAATWDGERDAGRVRLGADGELPPEAEARLEGLAEEGRRALRAEGFAARGIALRSFADLRHVGAETALTVLRPDDGDWSAAFARVHRDRFGYERAGRRSR